MNVDDNTPTTDEVREVWKWQDYENGYYGPHPADTAGFDRWLADEKAKALEEAAADVRARGDVGEEDGPTVERYLTIRAQQIREGLR